eukprot:2774782-Pleurochrysis_carterae.AAC.2
MAAALKRQSKLSRLCCFDAAAHGGAGRVLAQVTLCAAHREQHADAHLSRCACASCTSHRLCKARIFCCSSTRR